MAAAVQPLLVGASAVISRSMVTRIPYLAALSCMHTSTHLRMLEMSIREISHTASISSSKENTPPGADKQTGGNKTEISEFRQLTPLIKRIILRIHPDMVATAASNIQDDNAAALQDVFKFFDGLKAYCEARDVSSLNKPPQLKPRYTLSMWYFLSAGTVDVQTRELKRASVVLSVPAALPERTRILARKGMHGKAKAEWMSTAIGCITQLAAALGMPPLALELHASLAEHLTKAPSPEQSAEEARKESESAWAGAEMGLRDNLLKVSPLVQGKGSPADTAAALRALDPEKAAPSVYRRREREARMERFLGRRGSIVIAGFNPASNGSTAWVPPSLRGKAGAEKEGSAVTSAYALARLKTALVELHDPLQLYHPIWDVITVMIGGTAGGYACDASKHILYLPMDFTRTGLFTLVTSHVPSMIASKLKTARVGGTMAYRRTPAYEEDEEQATERQRKESKEAEERKRKYTTGSNNSTSTASAGGKRKSSAGTRASTAGL